MANFIFMRIPDFDGTVKTSSGQISTTRIILNTPAIFLMEIQNINRFAHFSQIPNTILATLMSDDYFVDVPIDHLIGSFPTDSVVFVRERGVA